MEKEIKRETHRDTREFDVYHRHHIPLYRERERDRERARERGGPREKEGGRER